jgi:hypothetical protein
MDGHITQLLMALTRAGQAARRPLIDREVDPVEWVAAVGQILKELDAAAYEARQIERIVESNRRRGTTGTTDKE